MTPKKDNATPRRPLSRMVKRKTLHARAASRDDMDDFESEAEPGMKLSQAFFVVLLLHILAVGGIYAFNQIKSVSKAAPTAKAEAPAEPIAKPAPLNEEVAATTAAAELPAAATATSGRTHTVVAGDTLHRIAGKFGVNVAALEKANNLGNNAIIRVGQVLSIPEAGAATDQAASTPTKAEPAVVAKAPPTIPAAEKPMLAAPKAAEQKEVSTSSSSKTYTVAKGDNPYSIAKKLKVNPIELMKANKIDDPRKLQIGQKLVVP